MATDPVCNMEVVEAEAKFTSEHMGKTYYFCSPGCKKSFDDNPGNYASESGDHEGHMHHNHGDH